MTCITINSIKQFLYRLPYLMPAVCCLLLVAAPVPAADGPELTITGSVAAPLSLSLKDLQNFQTVTCQRNDVTTGKKFHGVFQFRGVPLRTLLETAGIAKKDKVFKKGVDMAVVVRNADTRVAVSWGEIFYRNPAEIFVAWAGTPILPHKSCRKCHQPEVFEPVMERYHRDVSYPRIIFTADRYADRCLEKITEIEVTEFTWTDREPAEDPLHAKQFTITGPNLEKTVFTDLSTSGFSTLEADIYTVGEGKGFHNRPSYSGFSFTGLIAQACNAKNAVKKDEKNHSDNLATVFRVSAPDNYRSVFSWGELFLNPDGKRMLMADQDGGVPLEQGGRYFLIVPDDLMADRWVKAVEAIEKFHLK